MEKEIALRRALDAVQHLVDPVPPWGDIIRNSCEVMGSYAGGFIVAKDGKIEELQQFDLDERACSEYLAYYYSHDILLPTDGPRPIGTWLDTERILSTMDRRRNVFYQDFMCKHRMRQIVSLVVDETATLSAAFSFERETASDGGEHFYSSAPVVELTNAIKAGIAKRKKKAEAWVASTEEAFACFDEAMCLVGPDGAVVHASALTGPLLEAQCGLRIRNGRFWHPVPKVRLLVAEALSQAALEAKSVSLLLPGDGGRTCLFDVARAGYQAHLDARPLLMVRLRRGQPKGGPRLEALCATLGLTETEGYVLHGLVEGKTPESIASEHGVSINTVRKQISTVMDKAGCTRQLDLVRMVLSGG